MAVNSDTLFSMRGRVSRARPGLSPVQIQDWINDRIRQALDARIYWVDLVRFKVLSIPDAHTTGTVSVTAGSKDVTGFETAWPINDVVNTSVALEIEETGFIEVTPVSMDNIEVDRLLYLSSGSAKEAVAVVEIDSAKFTAKLLNTHTAPITVTSSSLAGRQFRIGTSSPIFTVRAVTLATKLIIDEPWGAAALSDQDYQIVQVYYTISPRLRTIKDAVDRQQGRPIKIGVPRGVPNWRDPQRSASSDPTWLVDRGPNEAGSMQYEIWPLQTSARQLEIMFYEAWDELKNDTDRPPWFINPTVFVNGALADAFRHKTGQDDVFFNPQLAQQYEIMYRAGVEEAKNADEAKEQKDFQFNEAASGPPGGANFWQSHDPDLFFGGY